ncbi:SCP2 sterol-binding domain-containing protein [Neobacillus mesonae]|nr:SCP2 sterol-binding domain-containing protein [Neobacillus mesonae]
MIEILSKFVQALEHQAHVLPLIRKTDLQLHLEVNDQTAVLVFHNGEIFIKPDAVNQLTRFKISGTKDSFKLLLEGKEKLRKLERTGRLEVIAPLRTTLLLESIFYLTRPDDYLEKII